MSDVRRALVAMVDRALGADPVAALRAARQSARERYRVIVPAPPPHVVAMDRHLRHNRQGERMIRELQQRGRPDQDDDVVPW